MSPLREVEILRVLLGETTRHEGRPVYELIVEEARRRGMAGATAYRGFIGFGASSVLRTAKILRLSEDLPVIVDIVDTPERIADFLVQVEGLVSEGCVLVQQAKALFPLPLRVRDVMTADVATVKPETPLSAVVELLLRRQVKAVPVLAKGRVKGIVTGGDLLQRGAMALRLEVQRQLPETLLSDQLRQLDEGGLKAADVMSAPAQTIGGNATLSEALVRLAKRNLKRLPVLDDAGKLLGIVSRIDLLRAVGKVSALPTHGPSLPPGIHRTVRDVMIEDVPRVAPETPLPDVLSRLVASPLRRVVVVDTDDVVLGIVLDRDLVASFARRNKPGLLHALVAALSRKQTAWDEPHTVARDVMETEVFSIGPDEGLAELVQRFVKHGIKRIVVSDDAGRLLGMADRDRLLAALGSDD